MKRKQLIDKVFSFPYLNDKVMNSFNSFCQKANFNENYQNVHTVFPSLKIKMKGKEMIKVDNQIFNEQNNFYVKFF